MLKSTMCAGIETRMINHKKVRMRQHKCQLLKYIITTEGKNYTKKDFKKYWICNKNASREVSVYEEMEI